MNDPFSLAKYTGYYLNELANTMISIANSRVDRPVVERLWESGSQVPDGFPDSCLPQNYKFDIAIMSNIHYLLLRMNSHQCPTAETIHGNFTGLSGRLKRLAYDAAHEALLGCKNDLPNVTLASLIATLREPPEILTHSFMRAVMSGEDRYTKQHVVAPQGNYEEFYGKLAPGWTYAVNVNRKEGELRVSLLGALIGDIAVKGEEEPRRTTIKQYLIAIQNEDVINAILGQIGPILKLPTGTLVTVRRLPDVRNKEYTL